MNFARTATSSPAAVYGNDGERKSTSPSSGSPSASYQPAKTKPLFGVALSVAFFPSA